MGSRSYENETQALEKMKSVWIILPFYRVGGVEKWARSVSLALQDSYKVTVYITGDIDPQAEHIFQDVPLTQVSKFKLFILACFHSPDFVISALTPSNVFSCIVFGFRRTKVITSIHLTLKRISAHSDWHQFKRISAHIMVGLLSDKILAVSNGVKSDIDEIICRSDAKVSVIYNPCFPAEVLEESVEERLLPKSLKFVAVGRIDEQKKFATLVEGFKIALQRGCDYELDIYGDGPLLEDLQNLIKSDITQKIRLLGNKSNIVDRLKSYDVFFLSSAYEGFGNVLAEALSANLCCIARDCPHGPSEILANGEFGFLISRTEDIGTYLVNFQSQYEDFLKASSNDLYQLKLKQHLLNFTEENFGDRLNSIMSDSDNW